MKLALLQDPRSSSERTNQDQTAPHTAAEVKDQEEIMLKDETRALESSKKWRKPDVI